MKGWTVAGVEVDLTRAQEEAVLALLSPHPIKFLARKRGWGWSTALATATEYDRQYHAGITVPHDVSTAISGIRIPANVLIPGSGVVGPELHPSRT